VDAAEDGAVDGAEDAAEDVEGHNRHRREITRWEYLHLRPRKFNKLLRKVAVGVERPSRRRRQAWLRLRGRE
jgi:hypothetical protein